MISNLEEKLYFILFGLMAGIVTFNIIGVGKLVSICFYATFLLVAALWACQIKSSKFKWSDKMLILIIGICISCVVLNAILTKTPLSFGYVKKVIFYIFTFIFLRVACDTKVSPKAARFMINSNTYMILFMVVMYLFQREQMYIFNDIVTRYLTFGFNNPNEVALFLVCLGCVQAIVMVIEKRKLYRMFHAVLFLATCYFIWETHSRNAQMAMLIFMALICWIWFPKRKMEPFNEKVIIFSMIFPLIFATIYILFIDNTFINQTFSFMVSEGKKLSSRMKFWGPAVSNLMKSPIIGAYSQISEGTGAGHMHNTHLDMLASYGIVAYGVMITFIVKIVKKIVEKCEHQAQYLCIAGFIGAYMLGMGEAAMFSGGLGIYILIIEFLLLVQSPMFEKTFEIFPKKWSEK